MMACACEAMERCPKCLLIKACKSKGRPTTSLIGGGVRNLGFLPDQWASIRLRIIRKWRRRFRRGLGLWAMESYSSWSGRIPGTRCSESRLAEAQNATDWNSSVFSREVSSTNPNKSIRTGRHNGYYAKPGWLRSRFVTTNVFSAFSRVTRKRRNQSVRERPGRPGPRCRCR